MLLDILPTHMYRHFLSLSISIRILCDAQLCQVLNNHADKLLRWFVSEYGNIYGKFNIIYNVHNFVHLANDVKKFGSLEDFSSFKYESYLGKLKSKVRASSKPLHQINNRIIEENLTYKKEAFVISSYPIIHYKNGKDQAIQYIQFSTFTISINKPDNCCLLKNGNSVIINDIYTKDKDISTDKTEIKLRVQKFINTRTIFLYAM